MHTTVYWVACEPERVGILPRDRGGDWPEDESQSLRDRGVGVLASLLTPEENRVAAPGCPLPDTPEQWAWVKASGWTPP